MVLTNFECWAHGESYAAAAGFETSSLRPHLDPFNPRAVGFISDANNNNSSDNNSATDEQPTPEVLPLEVLRCKKRLNPHGGDCGGGSGDMDQPVYTKRCRYDDADLAAQYCNDFFSLPATQIIGTQACLMDYEMQASGDGKMMESESSVPHQEQPHFQQQYLQEQQRPQRIYQHYQGHLHRANRDVSRCMMSHMI
ncbi:hypothetical protein KR032_004932 [Drosophila birchii]|nr:hypothetical protein KR032_004932 [Drosophila birchii]